MFIYMRNSILAVFLRKINLTCSVIFVTGNTQNVAELLFCHVFSLPVRAKMTISVVFFQILLHFCIIFSTGGHKVIL